MKKSHTQEIKNPELRLAMRALANNNHEVNRSSFAAALVKARMLSPIVQQTVMVENEGPSTRVKFETIVNTEGDGYYMAFTDMDEYNKWNDGTHDKALIMTIEDYGNILLRNPNKLKGFVINPFSDNICVSKKLLLSLLQQHEKMQMKGEA